MITIVLIVHNVRSTHNVGSLLRTAEGLGVQQVILSGYTPRPTHAGDQRLPHIAQRADAQIAKTALGAEKMVHWRYTDDLKTTLDELRQQGFIIAALEQAPDAHALPQYRPPDNIALIVGREVEGIEPEVLAQCDLSLEIPMLGQKESFNVAQAAAMALYHLRFGASKQDM